MGLFDLYNHYSGLGVSGRPLWVGFFRVGPVLGIVQCTGLVPGGVVGLFEEFVEALETALVEAAGAEGERKHGDSGEHENG